MIRHISIANTFSLLCVLVLSALAGLPAAAQPYDLVINNGRVTELETMLDAVRNVSVKDGNSLANEDSGTEGCVGIRSEALTETHVFTSVPHNHLVIIDREHQLTVRPMRGIT